jgi:hypothetical protein
VAAELSRVEFYVGLYESGGVDENRKSPSFPWMVLKQPVKKRQKFVLAGHFNGLTAMVKVVERRIAAKRAPLYIHFSMSSDEDLDLNRGCIS